MELKRTISSLRQENAALSDAFVRLCSGGSDWHTVLEGLPAHVSQRLPPSPPPLLTPPRTASPLVMLTHTPQSPPLLTPPRAASPLATLTHHPPLPSAGRQGGSLLLRPEADLDAAADAATVIGDPVDCTAAPAYGASGVVPRAMATSEPLQAATQHAHGPAGSAARLPRSTSAVRRRVAAAWQMCSPEVAAIEAEFRRLAQARDASRCAFIGSCCHRLCALLQILRRPCGCVSVYGLTRYP